MINVLLKVLKRSNKFSIVFEETEDDEQLTYEDSPRSNRSNKEEEIVIDHF